MTKTVNDGSAADVNEVSRRLTVEIFVAAWRTASLRWTAQGGHGGRPALTKLVDDTFAEIPAALTSPV